MSFGPPGSNLVRPIIRPPGSNLVRPTIRPPGSHLVRPILRLTSSSCSVNLEAQLFKEHLVTDDEKKGVVPSFCVLD